MSPNQTPGPIPPDDWCQTFVPGLGYIPAIPEPFILSWLFGLLRGGKYICGRCHQAYSSRPDYELHYALDHLGSLK